MVGQLHWQFSSLPPLSSSPSRSRQQYSHLRQYSTPDDRTFSTPLPPSYFIARLIRYCSRRPPLQTPRRYDIVGPRTEYDSSTTITSSFPCSNQTRAISTNTPPRRTGIVGRLSAIAIYTTPYQVSEAIRRFDLSAALIPHPHLRVGTTGSSWILRGRGLDE